ncbi:hypothetical protein [Anaerostipes hadrus]|uniref:hypothetical protein n=1 Tax=Anaerostipes hadrus TaxID=649756 RepID=UPI001FC80386|nr:hypothetical protein [Anaerostipes hadrus]
MSVRTHSPTPILKYGRGTLLRFIENQVYDLAFDIEMDTGVDISPIIKNEEQYEYWLDTLPFYKNIYEEGVIVNG